MKNKISNFIWNSDKEFCWIYNDKDYKRDYKYIPQSIIVLNDKSGIAIVGSYEEFGISNAFIINADNSIRFFLQIPQSIKNPICFHEIYYIGRELTAIIATNNFDYTCVINEKNGIYKRIFETR
jgi:hypothetical protein